MKINFFSDHLSNLYFISLIVSAYDFYYEYSLSNFLSYLMAKAVLAVNFWDFCFSSLKCMYMKNKR